MRPFLLAAVIAACTSIATLLSSQPAAAQPGRAPARPATPSPGFGTGAGYCAQYGVAGTTAPFSFDNVFACSPVNTAGVTPFDSNGTASFQCVELSARFLWAIDGIWAGPGSGVTDGADLVGVVHGNYPAVPVATPGPGSVPVPGDVISLGPGGLSDPVNGHTAVVVSSDPSTGQFTIMSENFPDGKAGRQTLQVDLSGAHNGEVAFAGASDWTSARWLETGNRTPPTGTVAVALIPGTTQGYSLNGDGTLSAFGGAPAATQTGHQWPNWQIARGVAILPDGTGGYVLDGWGGIHPFAIGGNPMPPGAAGGRTGRAGTSRAASSCCRAAEAAMYLTVTVACTRSPSAATRCHLAPAAGRTGAGGTSHAPSR